MDFGDFNVGFNEWGDTIDAAGQVQPMSIESNSIGSLSPNDPWFTTANPGTVTTTAPAAGSWAGLSGSLPQYVQSGLDVVKTGFGLSLAKDQLQANNAIARLGLQQAQYQAAGAAGVAQYQAAAKIAGAQAQAQLASMLSNPLVLIALIGGVILLVKSK